MGMGMEMGMMGMMGPMMGMGMGMADAMLYIYSLLVLRILHRFSGDP